MSNKTEEQAELRAIVEGFFSKSMLARSPTKVDMLVQELSEHTAKQKEKWEKEKAEAVSESKYGMMSDDGVQRLVNDLLFEQERRVAHLSSKEQEAES